MAMRVVTVVIPVWDSYCDHLTESVTSALEQEDVNVRVIVVDNNSRDRTADVARAHSAIVVHESQPGYGRCVYRALQEGLGYSDTELTLLCEGDMTFRAYDIDKFMAYIPHADIVNGTRIVEQLKASGDLKGDPGSASCPMTMLIRRRITILPSLGVWSPAKV
jgi:glycosyltransferase involved in cell wall biosynthesis